MKKACEIWKWQSPKKLAYLCTHFAKASPKQNKQHTGQENKIELNSDRQTDKQTDGEGRQMENFQRCIGWRARTYARTANANNNNNNKNKIESSPLAYVRLSTAGTTTTTTTHQRVCRQMT